MNRDHFWLTDAQFAWIAPHLPTDTRGKPRVDDRRAISGIIHVLKSGARWVDAPSAAPHLQLGRQGSSLSIRRQRGAQSGDWPLARRTDDQHPCPDRRPPQGLPPRVAPRYDRLAMNFLAVVCIAATVSYWL